MGTIIGDLFRAMDLPAPLDAGPRGLGIRSPIDGGLLASVEPTPPAKAGGLIGRARSAQLRWQEMPAPRRGELIRLLGGELRAHKTALGELVTRETGKILQEGLGEVQEMIDICNFAVGLSRQLYGLVIASERPNHKLLESWHPFGLCGVITAFNFPVAVWAWNAALALVCGNAVVWKPSEKTPLSALAAQALFARAVQRFGGNYEDVLQVLVGDGALGRWLVEQRDVRLISATGSTSMGRAVGVACARQFKRAILELGGNNAAIVSPSADLDLALRAVTFAAVGTAGQRCTSLRRLFVHESLYDGFVARLKAVYASIPIGDPLDAQTLVGPLVDGRAFEAFAAALAESRAAGAAVTGGRRVLEDRYPEAYYVEPAIVEVGGQTEVMLRETFAPILYAMPYRDLSGAIALNNTAGHGLSSSIFTRDLGEAERFMSACGSDCGIVNVNAGTSGAEIGGAFGGEKETGGGREAGSDAWKAYMRRATNTINYGHDLPLAQGIRFDLGGEERPS